jgi:hypothetical protein
VVDDLPQVVAYMKDLRAKWIKAEVARLLKEDPSSVRAAISTQ